MEKKSDDFKTDTKILKENQYTKFLKIVKIILYFVDRAS
jgi:hypothetical protein